MDNISQVIMEILVSHGIGVFAGTGEEWSIQLNSEPDGPDNTITIYDLDSFRRGYHNKKNPFTTSPFQIRVRSKDYDAVQNIMKDIEELLHRYGSFGRDDVWYSNILKDGDRRPLGTKQKDSQERHIWVQTFNAYRERRG